MRYPSHWEMDERRVEVKQFQSWGLFVGALAAAVAYGHGVSELSILAIVLALLYIGSAIENRKD